MVSKSRDHEVPRQRRSGRHFNEVNLYNNGNGRHTPANGGRSTRASRRLAQDSQGNGPDTTAIQSMGYVLDRKKALSFKLANLDNTYDFKIDPTLGGTVIECSTLLFEPLKPTVYEHLCNQKMYDIDQTIKKDKTGSIESYCWKMIHKLNKALSYTVNMYNTKNKMLINGSHQAETNFVKTGLFRIVEKIKSLGAVSDTVKHNMKLCLSDALEQLSIQHEDHQRENNAKKKTHTKKKSHDRVTRNNTLSEVHGKPRATSQSEVGATKALASPPDNDGVQHINNNFSMQC